MSAVSQNESEVGETPDEEQNGAVGDLSSSSEEEIAEETAVTMNM